MCINKSQEFVYFQNKTKHYDNIRKIKHAVNDHLNKCYMRTIDSNPYDHKVTNYMKQYQIKKQNQYLTNRVINIIQSPRRQLAVQGDYSRYNNFDRSFRKKNPYRDEQQRQRNIDNLSFSQRLRNTKPIVGTLTDWNQNHIKNTNYSRNLSRYINNQKSKGELHISTQKFVPYHYRSFIDDESIDKKKKIILTKQKLLQLPLLRQKNYSDQPFKFALNFRSSSTIGQDNV